MYIWLGKKGRSRWLAVRRNRLRKELGRYAAQANPTLPRSRQTTGLCRSFLEYETSEPKDERTKLGHWYIDIDCKDDLERARQEAIKAAEWFVEGGAGVRIRFSGHKGFGVEVDGRAFQREPGYHDTGFLLAQKLNQLLIGEIGLDASVVDSGIYGRRTLIQFIGTLHPKTNLYATPLTLAELRDLSIDQIKALARERRKLDRPKPGWHTRMAALFDEAEQTYLEDARSHQPYSVRPTAEQLFEIGEGTWGKERVTPCLRDLMGQSRPIDLTGRRFNKQYSMAVVARACQLREDVAAAMLTHVARWMIHSGEDDWRRQRGMESAVRTAYANQEQIKPTTCGSMRSMGLECADRCPFHQEYQEATEIKRTLPSRRENYEPPARPEPMTLAECREHIEAEVSGYLQGDSREAQLHIIPAGGGKTYSTLRAALEWCRGTARRLIYIAARHELIEQVNGWYGRTFRHIWPRSLPDLAIENGVDQDHHCHRHQLAAELTERGYSAIDWVCSNCPRAGRLSSDPCGYLRQFQEPGHWGMTTAMALGLKLQNYGHDAMIVDESITQESIEQLRLTPDIVEDTQGKATIEHGWPDIQAGEWIEYDFDTPDEVQEAWKWLCKFLRSGPTIACDYRGADVVDLVHRALVASGVRDPVEAMTGMAERRVLYLHEGEIIDPLCLPRIAWVEPVVGALARGMRTRADHPCSTGAIPLRYQSGGRGAGYVMTVGTLRQMDTRRGNKPRPCILLDATGSEAIYRRLLGREIEVVRAHVPNDPAQVTQINDAKYARSTLFSERGHLRADTWPRIQKYLEAVCQHAKAEDHSPGKTLIVTYMALESKLRSPALHAKLGGPERVEIAHYWGQRGKDYSEYDQAVLIGYPYPAEDEIFDLAAVLYEGEALDTTIDHEWRPYLHGDGKTGVEVRRYRDSRVQAVLEQIREAEYYQAAMRVRPLGAPHKRVVLLSQTPMRLEDGLEVGNLSPAREILAGEPRRLRRVGRQKTRILTVGGYLLRKLGWITSDMLLGLTTGVFCGTGRYRDSITSNAAKYLTTALRPQWDEIRERLGAQIRWEPEAATPEAARKAISRFRRRVHSTLHEFQGLELEVGIRGRRGRRPKTTVYLRDREGYRRFLDRLLAVSTADPDVTYYLGGEAVNGVSVAQARQNTPVLFPLINRHLTVVQDAEDYYTDVPFPEGHS